MLIFVALDGFEEVGDLEVGTIQVVFQGAVDFGDVHGVAKEHSFAFVGQRVDVVALEVEVIRSVHEAVAQDLLCFHRGEF